MPPELDDALTWFAAAHEHLGAANDLDLSPRIRCFHAQRAAELAMKAVLIHRSNEFPHTHSLVKLAELISRNLPDEISRSTRLTPYAVQEMYPDTFSDLDDAHVTEACELAQGVIVWCTQLIAE